MKSEKPAKAGKRAKSGKPTVAAETSVGVAGPMPEFIELMAATLVPAAFDDPDWLFEMKWDGFRVEAVVGDGEVRVWTRGRQDARMYFGPLLSGRDWIDARQAIVDGEVVALDDEGRSDFALLQRRIKQSRAANQPQDGVTYQVFDLLYLDGYSLLDAPLEERQGLLRTHLRGDPAVRFGDHVVGAGRAFFETARTIGAEGIVAKLRNSRYEPGRRSPSWQKIKNRPEQELIVGGWTTGIGPATELAALLVGVLEDGQLRYVGKVGSGFNGQTRDELLAQLRPLRTDDIPFSPPPPRPVARSAVWVRPKLVI
ncbi:MAG: non-homologous end-joining DNA ligase, partial [Chloroflexota bacterium]|nr:non-homologous end-joining DNA ligase [Chloroflexota bacterium]